MGPRTKGRMSDLRWPVATATAFPAAIIGAWLVLGDRLPPEALAVLVGTFAMSLVWAAVGMAFRADEARISQPARIRVKREPAPLAAGVPGLELLYEIPSVMVPCAVKVVGAVGVCPQGLRVNDVFSVNEEGRLSSPICRTACEGLELTMMRVSKRRPYEQHLSCLCPVAGTHLTFAVRPASPVGAH